MPHSNQKCLHGDSSRRSILATLLSLGISSTTFARALFSQMKPSEPVTAKMINQAEWIAGLQFTNDDRNKMLEQINRATMGFEKLRTVSINNDVPPALMFHVENFSKPAPCSPRQKGTAAPTHTNTRKVVRPKSDEKLAFFSIKKLAELLATRQLSSVELTTLYLERLHRFDPVLKCVITYLDEDALSQARQADREIASGRYRGLLHGIPWGAKDLFALPGHPTTWGAEPYRNQILDQKSAVIERLEDAGAVLIAKLTLGALAMGDVWFGGKTRNPWNPEQGSSGSSAGSASVTAAGLAGFTIGTETLGSIVSPCSRCGVSGLRPTFGRISRHGTMTLCWSMDKIGPIARSAEDCGLVFSALHGIDSRDPTTVEKPFDWPSQINWPSIRVGYVEALFNESRMVGVTDPEQRKIAKESLAFDLLTLQTLKKMSREMGFELRPIRLPDEYPLESVWTILRAEAAASFDDVTRSGSDDQLVRQDPEAWPTIFRVGQLTSAVDYIRANRIRTMIMKKMEEVMLSVDAYLAPSFGPNLMITNITGHPALVVPNGFRKVDGTPTSITFTGKLFGEATILALAHAYQQRTGFHQQHPLVE